MKATTTLLAALVVSAATWTSASAQYSDGVTPVGHATVNVPAAVGYASCGGGASGCDAGRCGKFNLLGKLGLKKNDCDNNGCGDGKGICSAIKSWLCRPYPSNAPRIARPEYPLGFPTHPYLRSPRDYFMMD